MLLWLCLLVGVSGTIEETLVCDNVVAGSEWELGATAGAIDGAEASFNNNGSVAIAASTLKCDMGLVLPSLSTTIAITATVSFAYHECSNCTGNGSAPMGGVLVGSPGMFVPVPLTWPYASTSMERTIFLGELFTQVQLEAPGFGFAVQLNGSASVPGYTRVVVDGFNLTVEYNAPCVNESFPWATHDGVDLVASGNAIVHTCSNGMSFTRLCTDGVWSGPVLTCSQDCDEEYIDGATSDCSSSSVSGAACEWQCTEDGTSASRTCSNGTWSGPALTCSDGCDPPCATSCVAGVCMPCPEGQASSVGSIEFLGAPRDTLCQRDANDDYVSMISISDGVINVEFYPSSSGSYSGTYGVCVYAAYQTADSDLWFLIDTLCYSPGSLDLNLINTWSIAHPASITGTHHIRAGIIDRTSSADVFDSTLRCASSSAGTSSGTGRHYDNVELAVFSDGGCRDVPCANGTVLASPCSTECSLSGFYGTAVWNAGDLAWTCPQCDSNAFCAGAVTCTGPGGTGEVCAAGCNPGSFDNAGMCTMCPFECATCDSGGSCTTCAPGYYNNGVTCVACSRPGCLCDDDGPDSCLGCIPGFGWRGSATISSVSDYDSVGGCASVSADDDITGISVVDVGGTILVTVSFIASTAGTYTEDYGICLRLVSRNTWTLVSQECLEPFALVLDGANEWTVEIPTDGLFPGRVELRASLIDRAASFDEWPSTVDYLFCASSSSGTDSGTGRHYDNRDVEYVLTAGSGGGDTCTVLPCPSPVEIGPRCSTCPSTPSPPVWNAVTGWICSADGCPSFCLSCDGDVCTSCLPDYILEGSTCNPSEVECTEACAACTLGTCTACISGYRLVGTLCAPATSTTSSASSSPGSSSAAAATIDEDGSSSGASGMVVMLVMLPCCALAVCAGLLIVIFIRKATAKDTFEEQEMQPPSAVASAHSSAPTFHASSLRAVPSRAPALAPGVGREWTCSCGVDNVPEAAFCAECGSRASLTGGPPAAADALPSYSDYAAAPSSFMLSQPSPGPPAPPASAPAYNATVVAQAPPSAYPPPSCAPPASEPGPPGGEGPPAYNATVFQAPVPASTPFTPSAAPVSYAYQAPPPSSPAYQPPASQPSQAPASGYSYRPGL